MQLFRRDAGQRREDLSPTTDDEVRAVRAGAQPRPNETAAMAGPRDGAPGSTIAERDADCVDAVRTAALRMKGSADDYDDLLDRINGARVVLLGEASHGTHEFYRIRAELTKRLVTEKNFRIVAAEADWPDAYRVNRYVRGRSGDADAAEALADFARFPTWMWRNADALDFIGWLREHNDRIAEDGHRAGFYGLDLYSLSSSIEAVLRYLDAVDPAAASRARERYACFDHFGTDSQSYGLAAGLGLASSCENEVIAQLADLRRQAAEHPGAAPLETDERFFAEQNALVVKNAEEYYRTMFQGRVSSWNLRDRHMMQTLRALLAHAGTERGGGKAVVWAHNSHLGDARATDMSGAGELNLGQLVREELGAEAFSIGFTTYEGTVTAASEWDHSYEAILHGAGLERFMLMLGDQTEAVRQLRSRRLERAIGVIYRPQTERLSHYMEASLPEQFDVVIHVDKTRALEPMEHAAGWQGGEVPETYPSTL
jgi:erythromycin esterase-like protein